MFSLTWTHAVHTVPHVCILTFVACCYQDMNLKFTHDDARKKVQRFKVKVIWGLKLEIAYMTKKNHVCTVKPQMLNESLLTLASKQYKNLSIELNTQRHLTKNTLFREHTSFQEIMYSLVILRNQEQWILACRVLSPKRTLNNVNITKRAA